MRKAIAQTIPCLMVPILMLSMSGCEGEGGRGIETMDEAMAMEEIQTLFPDIEVPIDSCEGMDWGGETVVAVVALRLNPAYAILIVEHVPLCAGPIQDIADLFETLVPKADDNGSTLDALSRNNAVSSTNDQSTGGTDEQDSTIGCTPHDPHPQPALPVSIPNRTKSKSDPHPQPANG